MQQYSKIFAKTSKSAKKFASQNAYLLLKAGYIDQSIAGVYSYLPLGFRVLRKIEQIIREEMDKVSQEILMPSLGPVEIWEKTGRFSTIDVLLKATPANENSLQKHNSLYVLNPTHEDIVTPLVQKFVSTYKELPLSVYQIQTKFRNEPRAKSGLLRCREFRMKDAYSFHESEASLLEYYEKMKAVYTTIFERLGLGESTVMALASGGDFTENYSHEFQTICDAGEDVLFHDEENNIYYNKEVAPSQAPKFEQNGETEKAIEEVEGVGLIGVAELAKFLNIPEAQTTKTMIYENEKGEVIAAAVRGGYDISLEKLQKISGSKKLELASAEILKRVTNAEPGYAGILNLPAEVKVYCDESTKDRVNFECGANRTNYHTTNVNWGRDLPLPEQFFDLKIVKEGDLCPATGKAFKVYKAAEVGNIFPLNVKFSKAFNYKYVDQSGQLKEIYMGSYGIGPSRVMGVIAEKFNDETGLVWPKQVAPFDLHFVSLQPELKQKAQEIIATLEAAGYDVLWDDRDSVSPGEKLADADLLGIPVRILLSKRSLETEGVELKNRQTGETKVVKISELIDILPNF